HHRQQLHAALVHLEGCAREDAGARRDRVDQRDAHIVDQREAGERARQLEAARDAQVRASAGGQPVERPAFEGHRPGFVLQRAADAIDERALTRAVRADQAEALAGCHVEVDAVEGHESAEALGQAFDLEQRLGHGCDLLRCQSWTRPTMPLGAMITKPTSNTPTISRLTTEEMVTVATCCSVPSRMAPMSGPIQVVVPPIIGMAIEFTA